MTTTPTTGLAIGVVGLGHMGGAMADRLLTAGHVVYGTSHTRERAETLIAHGLRWMDTPHAVAHAADVIITSIPDDDTLRTVASGPDGVLAGLRAGTTWLEMSTVSPAASRELAACVQKSNAALLDAPVSGSVPQVQAGTLSIMVGGDADAYDCVEPVLRELGTPTHVGTNGQGLVLKLSINISLAVQMLAFAEGLQLATQSGIEPELALEVMANSPIGSPMLKARAPLVFDLPDEAWFTLGLVKKDVELARTVAQGLGLPLPTADRADEVLRLAHDLGYERRDLAAFFRVLQEMARGRANLA
jgi:3-hydroxyisobutyrate dehydrogenase-like beta-hydroxyacid dehydrogenase